MWYKGKNKINIGATAHMMEMEFINVEQQKGGWVGIGMVVVE